MANHILLPSFRRNGIHLQFCFCEHCRLAKYLEVHNQGFTHGQLFDLAFERIPRTENARLNSLFRLTLKKIIYGKVYKDACLRNTPYEDFGWWARTQPNFMRLDKTVREKFCRDVNQIDVVYRDWGKIVTNLTDPRLHHLDARKFSIDQFYRARNEDWCLNYNDLLRMGGRADLVYEEHKYQRILRYIIYSDILDDINHDAILTSMLGRRLQKDLMRISKNHDS
jgi:hypothetical protein